MKTGSVNIWSLVFVDDDARFDLCGFKAMPKPKPCDSLHTYCVYFHRFLNFSHRRSTVIPDAKKTLSSSCPQDNFRKNKTLTYDSAQSETEA